jgi:hypothetical protein
MKTYGQPRKIVTDDLRAYSAATKWIEDRTLGNRFHDADTPGRRPPAVAIF